MHFTDEDFIDPNDLRTLRLLAQFAEGQAGGYAFKYQMAPNHEVRTEALEGMLEYAYDSLVRNRHLNKKQSEDELTVQIVEQLAQFQVMASHDTQVGGHCDILVKGPERFQWIAEAKIHSTYGWLRDGFLQLSTRYGTALPGQNQGEIIIYCRGSNALEVLLKWRKKLEEMEVADIIEDRSDQALWFRSCHTCSNSGLDFFIRHRIVPLHFAPSK
ncbi:hypothetical protein [uncultured Sulfitobacter sp.]|mgnify:CR=1 FL=1|uniref:hypothetical protein n=1 Tax=uncultured Sulfitobacter sp. TaxID=191468 RepID=UPI0030FC5A75